MNEQEKTELEYYRRAYGANQSGLPSTPSPAQDALTEEEQAAFYPDALDYAPKYQIAERHRQVYGSWPKQDK